MTFLTGISGKAASIMAVLSPLALLVVAVPILSAAVREDRVTLSGTIEDCFRGNRHEVADMEVTAFAPAATQRLVTLLAAMSARASDLPGSHSKGSTDAEYGRLLKLLDESATLARDTTGNDGSFALRIPRLESVLIVGRHLDPAQPNYYGYLTATAAADTSLRLDMATDWCAPPRTRQGRDRLRV